MPKTKILVTGAGGFILSNYIRYILKNYSNYIVISLDRCDNASTLNELYINKDHDFYLADVSDEHIVDRIFQVEKPDYVIHGSWSYIKDNICGAQVISEACSKYGIKKLLYLSSNEVYGTLPTEEAQPFKESSKLNPGGLNGIQKISAESHIKYNKNYIIIRACPIFGNRQKIGMIPKMIYSYLNNINIIENGMSIIDWLHIKDFCSAIMLILEKAPVGEIYNLSSRQEFSNIEVFHEIGKHIKNSIEFGDNNQSYYRIALDNSKILSLGWKPEFKFKNSIEAVINWYYNNKWILKSLENK